ncbi:MAG: DNA-binding protein WhiA [Bacillota bacterium]
MSSYARQVKEELARRPIAAECCARAELRALLEMRGELVLSAQMQRIIIQTENASTARRIFSLFKYCFALTPQVLSGRKRRLYKKNAFSVQICGKEAVLTVLQALGFLTVDPQEGKYLLYRQEGGLQKACCRRAYLRGAFLASGSLNNPERDYHLEVISPCESYARSITETLAAFGLPARFFQRKNNQVVYIKEGEKISEFLRIIAAHGGLLSFENIRVVKGVRNKINRLVNCETANLTRTALAAHEQLANIRLVTNLIGLENLPPSLQEIARLRLRYPEATLKELAGLAHPALTKSTVNHRLRRLNALACKIKKAERHQG